MKKFVLKVLLSFFACSMLSVVIALGCFYVSSKRAIKALEIPPNKTTLFTGHSLTGCSIVPDTEEDTYRVIYKSSAPSIFSLIRLKEMERLGELKNIRRVVTFFGRNIVRDSSKDRMTIVMKSHIFLAWRYHKYLNLFLSDWLDLFFKMEWINETLIETPPTNGVPITTDENELAKLFPNIINQNHPGFGMFAGVATQEEINEAFKMNKFAFSEMKKLCDKNNIQLIVAHSPHLSWVRKNDWANKYIEKYAEMIKSLSITYFDCSDWMEDKYFRDEYHLLPLGAEVFTKKFISALETQPL